MIENPLKAYFKNYSFVLGSASPRRKELLEALGLSFEIKKTEVKEHYPSSLKAQEISDYLSELKALALQPQLNPTEIGITADTVVWHKENSLEKAKNQLEVMQMLETLAGGWHLVITSFSIVTQQACHTFSDRTRVKFRELSRSEIEFYTYQFKPFDKAGAYGIQEWIGLIGIERIEGSYHTVVGLPTHLLYKKLMELY